MTTIKHTLQREVFIPDEERLFSVVNVSKEGKRKKTCFLCAAVTTEKPVQVTLYKVKKSEKGDQYKKKASWALRQVKCLDAKYRDKDVSEFEISVDKVYKWEALSVAEKNAFIQSLWKLSHMYLVQKPEFLNIKPGLLDDTQLTYTQPSYNDTQNSDHNTPHPTTPLNGEGGGADGDEWKGVSEKEQSDLELLMSQCSDAITNAEAFIQELSKELSVLDGENIQSIMGSEGQVLNLMACLDEGVREAERLEGKLNEYEAVLESVKDSMEVMKDKDALMTVNNSNNKQLLIQLETLVSTLSISEDHVRALGDSELLSPRGVRECTLAMKALLKCLTADVKPPLLKLQAVQDQHRKLNHHKTTFTTRLSHHLNSLFIHQGNELGGGGGRSSLQTTATPSDLRLPPHSSSYRQLLPYCELMTCLKTIDPDIFNKLTIVYTNNLSKLFDHQIREFMSSARQQTITIYPSSSFSKADMTLRRGTLLTSPGSGTLQRRSNNSLASIHQSPDENKLALSTSSRTRSSFQYLDLVGNESGEAFDQIYEQVLSELEVWCAAEQDLCIKFFNLDQPSTTTTTATNTASREPEGPWVQNMSIKDKRLQINSEVRSMMGDLFSNLEFELQSLHTYATNLNHYNSLYMLVRTGEHVLHTEDTGSFLSKTFANLLVQVKRTFDKFVDNMVCNMKEYKVGKKSKTGMLQFVLKFEEFAKISEWVFKNQSRRTDLDKAYIKIISEMFVEIGRVAAESPKTPSEVVLLENYHKLVGILSVNKIPSLEGSRKEARKRYSEGLQMYTRSCLGQPLDKVHQFFQGIEAKVATGMRFEDVGFQVQFSRQELKRNLKEYPGKEVKKGLEYLYKRVVKHLSEDTGLLQVVWHSMQDEFMKQYKTYQQMMARCYPGASISFDFSIEDILAYFSEIAQSH